MNERNVWAMIAVIAFVTAALRFLPFWIWSGKRKTPPLFQRLGQVLPYAIMGMLVVFCLKNVQPAEPASIIPAVAGCAVVAGTYLWKRNTLLSVISGTVCYMVLLQGVFA